MCICLITVLTGMMTLIGIAITVARPRMLVQDVVQDCLTVQGNDMPCKLVVVCQGSYRLLDDDDASRSFANHDIKCAKAMGLAMSSYRCMR